MPFTIRPDAAQAMQEDEAQLISAIAQVAQRVPAVLRATSDNATSNPRSDSLRIKMGRRLVYGQLADGPFRHELDANSLKVIADALQRPASLDFDPAKYERKVPAIEIFQDDILLFREERDGTVTTNEIHFQVERETQTAQQEQPTQSFVEAPHIEPELNSTQAYVPVEASVVENAFTPDVEDGESCFTVGRADQLLTTAEYLINPLRQEKGMYDAVSINGYQIKQSGQHITVSQGDRLLLVARSGEIMSDQVAEQDWAAFSQIQVPDRFPQPPSEVSLPSQNTVQEASYVENDAAFTEPYTVQEASHVENGTVLTEPQMSQIPEETPEGVDQQAAVFSVLERENQKLPDGPTRKLLQDTVRDWKQQASQWLSNKLETVAGWLKNQRLALQDQRLAGAVQQLFRRGHDRTGEHSYQVKGCTITRRSQNLYTLQDAAGELMQFKASKTLGLGRRLEVISVSDRITTGQRESLLSAASNPLLMPQSSLDVETAYAKKTRQAENTTRQFLKSFVFAKSWSKEGGQFKLEVGEGDLLRITDKQNGRGIIFQRQNGEVFSKMGSQDFVHFERLAAKMQEAASRREQSQQSATNNSKKATAIEMD